MKISKYPWGRCSKAIRNECKNPCSHYLAHHIPTWGHCWCRCEPLERPKEFKHWTVYNRMLMLRLTVEGARMQSRYRYDAEQGRYVVVGRRLPSSPHDHRNEKEFEHII